MHTRIGSDTLSASSINRWVNASDPINLPLPRRNPDGTGIVIGVLLGSLLLAILALIVTAAWRFYAHV